MKQFLLFIIVIISFFSCADSNIKQVCFDQRLADSLGSDEYGMRMYYMVILKTGPKAIADTARLDSIFRGHLDNIGKLANEGKLVVAGPLGKNGLQYRGIFIFKVDSRDELEKLLITDPAIKEQLLATEVMEWYGSAALPMYLGFHKKIEKRKY